MFSIMQYKVVEDSYAIQCCWRQQYKVVEEIYQSWRLCDVYRDYLKKIALIYLMYKFNKILNQAQITA